ncbi:hypothetical protein [Olsenella sp. oral taxon 807]|uniref:hypothetical protein n=1 Tax=Olsenella sp. oral taxon 807 TaxID=712411 RepID=UPI00067C6771|nr:hypothetical protein [Olsenella sp. oral taxon 807]
MNENNANTEYFLIDTVGPNSAAIAAGAAWLDNNGGGCILTQDKGTMRNALDVKTNTELKKIEVKLASYGISLNWSGVSVTHAVGNLMAVYANPTIDGDIRGNNIEKVFIVPWTEKDSNWFKAAFNPTIVVVNANGKLVKADAQPVYASVKDKLPEALDRILGYLAQWTAGYDNRLQWREEERFKADLMNHQADWKRVDPETALLRCAELGMSAEDSEKISSMIGQLKAGHKFRPKRGYEEGFGR